MRLCDRICHTALAISLLVGVPAHAFTTGVGGTGSTCSTMEHGETCFSDFTANGVDAVNVGNCGEVKVQVISNIASSTDHDASVELWACPAGTTTASAVLCRKIGFRNAAGTAVTVLDGDQANGTEAVYGIVAQSLVADVTTAAQTTRVQVECRGGTGIL